MLILRRKAGETLVIGDNITIAVLDINEGSVRLAIDAPKSIPILRSELLQAADANRDAAGEASPALFRLAGGERKGPVRAIRAARPVRPVRPAGKTQPEGTGTAPPPPDPAGTPEA